jgi:hypothetical protein
MHRGCAQSGPSSAMTCKLALCVLRVLLVASMGVLLAAGATLAHSPTRGGQEQRSSHAAPLPLSEAAKSAAPSECAYKASVIAPVAAVFVQSWPHDFASIPARDGADFTEFDADCCGVACHAAIADIGHDGAAWGLPLTAFVLNGSSVLHGRAQGPPERPPRIA